MLIPKKNRKEVYKYLFRGAYPGPSSQPETLSLEMIEKKCRDRPAGNPTLTALPDPIQSRRGRHLRQEGLQPPRSPRDQGGSQPSGEHRASERRTVKP